jgi:hypothetical protein
MNKLINLTPHDIVITGYGIVEPSGNSVKVHSHLSKVDDIDGVPIMCCKDARVSNLPDPHKGVLYIVPGYVRTALPHRKDLASPTKLIRDGAGRIVGCGALEINP